MLFVERGNKKLSHCTKKIYQVSKKLSFKVIQKDKMKR